MLSRSTIRALPTVLASLCFAGFAAAQQPAQSPSAAQASAVKPDDSGEPKSAVEEIVVTGTRVRRKDLSTPAPVTVLSREQIVETRRSDTP